MKREWRPLPFEVIWIQDGQRRQVTTFSEREAKALYERKRFRGLDPSVYVGGLEVRA